MFEGFRVRFWTNLGAPKGPKLFPTWSPKQSKSKQKRDKFRLEIWNLNKIRLFQEDESGQSSEDSINPKEGKEHESKKEHFGENRRLNETKMADMRDRLQVKVDGAP